MGAERAANDAKRDGGATAGGAETTAPTGGPRRAPRRTDGDAVVCESCGAEVSAIRIEVDGRTLLMQSCDICDTRSWHLAGERIDLQEALHQVGEHAGRRGAGAKRGAGA
ncbi:MAG: hypothetical protein AAF547_04405 [Actinomycetota bacterium]